MKRLIMALVLGWSVVDVLAQAGRPAAKLPGEVATLAGVEVVGTPGPGSNVVVIVRVTLEPGAAIYSSAPMDRAVVPASLYLSTPRPITVLPIVYPTPRKQPIPGTTRERLVYEEGLEVKVPVTMNNFVVLPATIPAVLNYQAVGKGPAMLPPRQLRFTVTLPKPAPAVPPKK